ncbi:MAG: ATP-binding cassette domain-containing protein [Clostridia bacterium]|nr:ATP-binding cassette domain-containing protein [Clostridia bacterium]
MKITLENISKSYDRPVLCGINCVFETGKLYVIKGVSGCGKSTLLNIIGGVQPNYEGRITADGQENFTCAYVFQKSLLVGSLTVTDNLRLVCGHDEAIRKAAQDVGIAHLLDRYPSCLSGGERSRASVARALLIPSDVVLADEPTASLDADNSARIARLLKEIAAEKAVIVATHGDCFDCLADEIISLDYGIISGIKKSCAEDSGLSPVPAQKKRTVEKPSKVLSPLKYALGRKSKTSLRRLIPLAVVFALLFIIAAVSDNFSSEYESFAVSRNVTDVVFSTVGRLETIKEKYGNVRVYYNCTDEKDGVTYLPLFDEKDSIFRLPDMIKRGAYPSGPDQVLVSAAYRDTHPETEPGSEITYRGKRFTVSGVLYPTDPAPVEGRNEKFVSFYRLTPYYRETLSSPAVLVFYDELIALNPGVHSDPEETVAFSYPELMKNKTVAEDIKRINGSVNQFYIDMAELGQTVKNVSVIVFGVYIICFAISCIFIKSNINIELFLRRKEFGYLQIFGVAKKWLKKAVLSEYAASFLLSVALGLCLAAVVCTAYSAIVGRFVFAGPVSVMAVTAGSLVIYIPAVFSSVRRSLKTPIISLIT